MKKRVSLYNYEQSKRDFIEFCKKNANLPVYLQAWYFDAACQNVNEWRVITVKRNNHIVAFFPFRYVMNSKRYWIIDNPFQVSRGGVWIDYGNRVDNYTKERFLFEIVEEIIDALPYYDVFRVNFNSEFRDWHPFYLERFQQTTRYSYVITASDYEEMISHCQNKLRARIKKAQKVYFIDYDMNPDEFISFYIGVLDKRGKKLEYDKNEFIRLCNVAYNNSSLFFVRAVDSNNTTVGAVGCLCDSKRVYLQYLAFDPDAEDAHLVCESEAIDYALKQGKQFDFEGSMNLDIASFYRKFGGAKEQYFELVSYSRKYEGRSAISKSIKYILGGFR